MRPFRIKSQIYPQHYLNIINRYKSTIFALCSGQGKCGVSVIRVSGPETLTVLKSMAGFKDPPKPRYAFLKGIKYPNSKELIDRGLVIWFPGNTGPKVLPAKTVVNFKFTEDLPLFEVS